MLAALSRVKDPDSRASSTDSVHSGQKQAHIPSRENIPSKENIGSPCEHDWLLATSDKCKGPKLMLGRSESPSEDMTCKSRANTNSNNATYW